MCFVVKVIAPVVLLLVVNFSRLGSYGNYPLLFYIQLQIGTLCGREITLVTNKPRTQIMNQSLRLLVQRTVSDADYDCRSKVKIGNLGMRARKVKLNLGRRTAIIKKKHIGWLAVS